MTLEEFLEQYNYSSFDEDVIADIVEDIEDADDLVKAAGAYITAKERFEDMLAANGFEWG